MSEIKRLAELSEKGQIAMRAAEGTEDTSFERAAAFADETHFRDELATWFRANIQSLSQESVRPAEDDEQKDVRAAWFEVMEHLCKQRPGGYASYLEAALAIVAKQESVRSEALADRLEAMLHQVGHPDYSLKEFYEGVKLIVWELRQSLARVAEEKDVHSTELRK